MPRPVTMPIANEKSRRPERTEAIRPWRPHALANSADNNTTGDSNIAIGPSAGLNLTTGSNNIDIGAQLVGLPGDANTIRIGNFNNNATYVAGIAGQTVGAGGSTCYVDNAGKLGVFLSARRYKENIQYMDDASAALFSLKPVTFRYTPEFDKSGTSHFGLIAEEVAEVAQDLVTHDAKGQLSTVRYEAVNVMLLNEFSKSTAKMRSSSKRPSSS
jgi:Chaperone of endosialidase